MPGAIASGFFIIMQNQKTESKQIDISDLPPLSEPEQRLVEAIGAGCNNTEAYARAYGRGNYSAPALRVQACKKVAEPQIQAHLDALRAVGFANASLTLQARLEEELAFAKRAELAGNFGAAGGAYDRINKLMGLYVDKVELKAEDPTDALKEIAKISPEIALLVARQEKFDEWQPDHKAH